MAEFIKLYDENPSEREIKRIVEVLKNDGVIIYPTDTVYGLGCDITSNRALERVAQLRGVKLAKANFSFICEDLSNLSDYVRQIDTPTFKLLKRALPGPYTFILPGNNNLPTVFKKKKTVGIPQENHMKSTDLYWRRSDKDRKIRYVVHSYIHDSKFVTWGNHFSHGSCFSVL